MKTIVTHISVDLDAITSCWLIRRFMKGWDEADIAFTPQQTPWNGIAPDSDPDVIYTDTGYGRFDHHQIKERLSATKRVFDYLMEQNLVEPGLKTPLSRLVQYVNDVDNFAEVNYPEPVADRYDFCLHQLVTGLRKNQTSDSKSIEIVSKLLDGAVEVLKSKTKAEKEIKDGYIFESKYGKSLAMNSANDEAMRLAQKMGYMLVVMKDPSSGFACIKTPPLVSHDLTPVYEKIKQADNKGFWFLHVLKNMLLNGSSVTPGVTPTPLTLQQLIAIVKQI